MAFDFTNFNQQAEKAVEHFSQELSKIRTGRATVQILDPVVVEAYGSKLKLNEVANVSAPDASLLMISPWDKTIIADIERSIASANLNLNPVVDGDIIRISVPPLTAERRQEMVKLAKQKTEAARAVLRGIRNEVKRTVEKQKGQDDISEDAIRSDLEELEKKVVLYNEKVESLLEAKNKELTSI